MDATSHTGAPSGNGTRVLAPGVGLLVAIALMAAIGVVAMMSINASAQSTRWVEHSYEVLEVLARARAEVALAEARRRGFTLTGDRIAREEMEVSLGLLVAHIAEARERTRDDAAQQERLSRLEAAVAALAEGLRLAARPLTAEGDLGAEAALTRTNTAMADRARAILADMERDERRLLRARMVADAQRAAATEVTTIACVAAALVMVGAAFVMVRRETRRRNRVEAALRLREETLDLTLAAIPDALIVVDRHGRIVRVNDHAPGLFGYDRDELIGAPIEMLVPEPMRAAHVGHRERFAQRPSTRPMGGGLKLTARRKDGSEVPVDINLSPLRTPQGDFTITAVRDVSVRVAAENELRRLHGAAETANRELESFSYSVAHDLRSPLRSIDGFSQALIDDYGEALPAQGHEYLQRTRAAAQRMARLIDDLLSLSRVTRSTVQRRTVDVSALAQAAADHLRDQERGREITVDVAPGMTAQGDPRLLAIALDNLLGNAFKFTRGRSDARVEVFCTGEGADTVFHVRDNGVGFDMTYVGKLFGVFQRLHQHDQFGGTGVGLATVQRIIHRHGGRIWADGKVDGGATFHFALP